MPLNADPPTAVTSTSRDSEPCIEIRVFDRLYRQFTVSEYVHGLKRSRSIGTRKGLSFHDLAWTTDAPLVQHLTQEWTDGRTAFRISDWDTYAWQMERLLGLR